MRRYFRFLSPARRLELFPPLWLMGVKVLELDDGFRRARFLLPLNWKSRNMGNHMFGGNQASLADPVAAMACVHLFPEYRIWTRRLTVDFKRPGATDLELRFEFPPALEAKVRDELATRGRSNPEFEYGYYLADGTQCTWIRCAVAIREAGFRRKTGIAARIDGPPEKK
ncbi:MAG: PaaI family thioesterase [Methylohalobius sp. ZOD2]